MLTDGRTDGRTDRRAVRYEEANFEILQTRKVAMKKERKKERKIKKTRVH